MFFINQNDRQAVVVAWRSFCV